MKKFWKWLDEDFEETILMFFLVIMACVMMWQIIMRYFFKASMSWPEEFCRYLFVFSGFLSIGYCVRREKMLKVDILLGFFPEGLKKAVDLIGRIVTLVFFAYLTYYAYFATMNSKAGGMKSSAMGWPMWIIYGSVFVGSAIGVVREIQDLYRWFKKNTKKEEAKSC
ncbi:MAG: TRAP transporter small permease [Lachnospiraceae bacterium]|nr:TRAP transporter small permease [Lachnospiraceae bacterium]